MNDFILAGCTHTAANAAPSPHYHESWEIVVYTKGGGCLTAQEACYPFSVGTIFCIPPYVSHWESSPQDYISHFLLLDDFRLSAGKFLALQDGENGKVVQIKKMLYDEFNTPSKNNHIALHLLLDLIFIYLQNLTDQKNAVSQNIWLNRFIQVLLEHVPDANFSLSKEIATLGIAPSRLRKLFMLQTHMRPVEFLNYKRIELAKATLYESPSVSVKALAAKCGFSDPYYFSNVFKRITGHSPTQWQKKYCPYQNA